MSTNMELLIAAVILVAVYSVIANRLLVFGQRFRDRALELGSKILENPAVSEDVKQQVSNHLCTLPNWLPAWGIAALVTPAAIHRVCLGTAGAAKHLEEYEQKIPPSLTDAYHDYHEAVLFAWMSNSPAAAFLTVVQFIVWSFVISGRTLVDTMVEKMAERISKHHKGHEAVQV